MGIKFSGGCLCGEVHYDYVGRPLAMGHCQCLDCRKSSGTGHSSHIVAPKAGFQISGETKAYESIADSGHATNRHFCPNCGAPVYMTSAEDPRTILISASSLDDLEVFKPQFVVFTKRGASWDYIDPDLAKYENMIPTDHPA